MFAEKTQGNIEMFARDLPGNLHPAPEPRVVGGIDAVDSVPKRVIVRKVDDGAPERKKVELRPRRGIT